MKITIKVNDEVIGPHQPETAKRLVEDHRAAHGSDDIFAGYGDFDDEIHHRCFHCNEYVDECICNGGLPT
ncbi:hypothetical protein LCGC14_0232710 [marine sediment metagenome]|uniref:Uncharacterized protein n=1 Tax=marine sediment metagenome TaxID=412755 RepID=A0A0F9UAC6_9ZZZZ